MGQGGEENKGKWLDVDMTRAPPLPTEHAGTINGICAIHDGHISHRRSNPDTRGVLSLMPRSYGKSQQQLGSSLGCWLCSPEAGGYLSLVMVVIYQTPRCHLPPRESVHLSVGPSWPSYLPTGEREETTSSWSTGEHLRCLP